MNNKALKYLIETSNNIEIGSYCWKPHKNKYQDKEFNISPKDIVLLEDEQ